MYKLYVKIDLIKMFDLSAVQNGRFIWVYYGLYFVKVLKMKTEGLCMSYRQLRVCKTFY